MPGATKCGLDKSATKPPPIAKKSSPATITVGTCGKEAAAAGKYLDEFHRAVAALPPHDPAKRLAIDQVCQLRVDAAAKQAYAKASGAPEGSDAYAKACALITKAVWSCEDLKKGPALEKLIGAFRKP